MNNYLAMNNCITNFHVIEPSPVIREARLLLP